MPAQEAGPRMAQRPSIASSPTAMRPAAAPLRRLRGLWEWLHGRSGAAPSAATAGGDPLALLRPLFAELIEHPESPAPFAALLRRVENLAGAEASALFAVGEDGEGVHDLADTAESERERVAPWLRQNLAQLRAPGAPTVESVDDGHPAGRPLVVVRLHDGTGVHGCLLLRLASGAPLEEQTRHTLEALAAALGGIVYGVRRAQLGRRLALYEERATIARELHDSLAQSLSYLKIQVSRMQALLARHGDPNSPGYAELDAVTQELRGNLNLAYRQLRELITTCRLTMNGRTLTQALEESAAEYAGRSAMVVELDNRLGDTVLDAHAEMQLLQIVRESLSNVVRHAHARRVQATLKRESDGQVSLSVEDDGCGFSTEPGHDGERHHGLLIMQERAHELGGELRVESRAEGGTRVLVRFRPGTQGTRA